MTANAASYVKMYDINVSKALVFQSGVITYINQEQLLTCDDQKWYGMCFVV